MKKILISLIGVILVFAVCLCLPKVNTQQNEENSYLRVHIRANSNEVYDQSVKMKVKTAVVDYLTPKLTNGKTFNDAYNILNSNLNNIEKVCDDVLSDNGYLYKSKAYLNDEYFPTRSYGELTLENGFYDALIIELGSGKGDNWWCVVYPPLCFIGAEGNNSNNIVYKSKLLEIIENFFSWVCLL